MSYKPVSQSTMIGTCGISSFISIVLLLKCWVWVPFETGLLLSLVLLRKSYVVSDNPT